MVRGYVGVVHQHEMTVASQANIDFVATDASLVTLAASFDRVLVKFKSRTAMCDHFYTVEVCGSKRGGREKRK